MNITIKFYFFLCTFIALSCEVEQSQRCDKRIIFRVLIQNDDELEFYNEIKSRSESLKITMDRYLRRLKSTVVFRTSACYRDYIENLLSRYNIDTYEVETYSDFSKRRDFDDFQNDLTSDVSLYTFDFDVPAKRYMSSMEIDKYIQKFSEIMNEKFPKIETKAIVEGYSHEGRPIQSIFIGYKGKKNPIVFLDAGIHAREWHSRSLALYFLQQLINEAELGDEGLLFNTSIIIVPNVNPDGYDYSLVSDKMWRKTRRPIKGRCIGVDGNRNYDVEWSMGDDERIPCLEVYKGENPFSESETKIVRDIMMRIKNECFLYISIHTYGNTIIYPYGYKKDGHPKKDLLHRIAEAGVKAVRYTTGTKFIADQSGTQLYIAAGGSDDYAIDVVGIPFAFTFEIGPEIYGFAVPSTQLKKTVFDGWIALKAMIIEAKELMKLV